MDKFIFDFTGVDIKSEDQDVWITLNPCKERGLSTKHFSVKFDQHIFRTVYKVMGNLFGPPMPEPINREGSREFKKTVIISTTREEFEYMKLKTFLSVVILVTTSIKPKIITFRDMYYDIPMAIRNTPDPVTNSDLETLTCQCKIVYPLST